MKSVFGYAFHTMKTNKKNKPTKQVNHHEHNLKYNI